MPTVAQTTVLDYGPIIARAASHLECFERRAKGTPACPTLYQSCAATLAQLHHRLGGTVLQPYAGRPGMAAAVEEFLEGESLAQQIMCDRAARFPELDGLMNSLMSKGRKSK